MSSVTKSDLTQHITQKDKAIASLKQSQKDLVDGKNSKKIDLAGNFEDMIKLALAGIQYQDPLNPKDASEFGRDAMRMAEAQAMVEIRDNIGEQNKMQVDNQLLQASAQVGRKVEMEGDKFSLKKDEKQELNYFLPKGVHEAVIKIKNDKGQIVHSHKFKSKGKEALEPKRYTYEFDGKATTSVGKRLSKKGSLPEGAYSFEIIAFDNKNKRIIDPLSEDYAKIPTTVTGTITGGRKTLNGAHLKMGDEVSYPLANLIGIQESKKSEADIRSLAQTLQEYL